ncbi:MAG: hypothetical protein OHK0029_05400 [Armatimonadaceae bacterium]
MWSQQRKRRYSPGSPDFRPRPGVFLAIALVVSIIAGGLHNFWRSKNTPDPILAGTRTLILPFQISSSRLQEVAGGLWQGMTRGPQLAAENERLKAELVQLRAENQQLRDETAEAARLRKILNFVQEKKKPFVVAKVIGLLPSPHFETITLNRGANSGIKPFSVVRTPEGLVGQVLECSPFMAQVLLLTDVKSRVHAVVRRDGNSVGGYGIVQGAGRDKPLKMFYLKREDDVRPGDVLYSSGFGGVIPPDIPIGTVKTVTEDTANYLKSAEITPLAPVPGDLREALVLR